LWVPVFALSVAALGGYVFTRVVSTPVDNQDVGNWACMLGLAALFVEGALVALSAYAISLGSQLRVATSAGPTVSAVAVPASIDTRIDQLNGSRR
jgi:hypothetical protein